MHINQWFSFILLWSVHDSFHALHLPCRPLCIYCSNRTITANLRSTDDLYYPSNDLFYSLNKLYFPSSKLYYPRKNYIILLINYNYFLIVLYNRWSCFCRLGLFTDHCIFCLLYREDCLTSHNFVSNNSRLVIDKVNFIFYRHARKISFIWLHNIILIVHCKFLRYIDMEGIS